MRSKSNTRDWINANARFAQDAEFARARLGHPTMQKLRSAIQLIGEAMKDRQWTAANDKNGQLRQILEMLVRVTALPPHQQ